MRKVSKDSSNVFPCKSSTYYNVSVSPFLLIVFFYLKFYNVNVVMMVKGAFINDVTQVVGGVCSFVTLMKV